MITRGPLPTHPRPRPPLAPKTGRANPAESESEDEPPRFRFECASFGFVSSLSDDSSKSASTSSSLSFRRRIFRCLCFNLCVSTLARCSCCCRTMSAPKSDASVFSCSFRALFVNVGSKRHFSVNTRSANFRSASPFLTGSRKVRIASFSLSNASLASGDGFLSGWTASDRLRNAFEISESVTVHTGRPASSHPGAGNSNAEKMSPPAMCFRIVEATDWSLESAAEEAPSTGREGPAGAALAAASISMRSTRSIVTGKCVRIDGWKCF